jgi:hypothetical protein
MRCRGAGAGIEADFAPPADCGRMKATLSGQLSVTTITAPAALAGGANSMKDMSAVTTTTTTMGMAAVTVMAAALVLASMLMLILLTFAILAPLPCNRPAGCVLPD